MVVYVFVKISSEEILLLMPPIPLCGVTSRQSGDPTRKTCRPHHLLPCTGAGREVCRDEDRSKDSDTIREEGHVSTTSASLEVEVGNT